MNNEPIRVMNQIRREVAESVADFKPYQGKKWLTQEEVDELFKSHGQGVKNSGKN